MLKKIDEIKDDELRVIGNPAPSERKKVKKTWSWVVVAVLGLAVLAGLFVLISGPAGGDEIAGVFEPETVRQEPRPYVPEKLGDYSDTTSAYTECLTRTINDIPLSIYIPHNATPSLSIGTPDIHDKSIVFITQAADIRADNGKINGAFVLDGKPLAWGLSKKGFVAIIDGKITVGVAENSPLFEKATETGGCFFRQYPLVDNRKIVENEPKNKAIRKAICDRGGEIIIVFSQTKESFHDFSQALVDLGVDNAVYLVGSEFSFGFCRDKSRKFIQFSDKIRGGQKWENYLGWR